MEKLSDRVAWALNTIKDDRSIGKGIRDIDLAKQLDINEKTLNTYKAGQGSLKSTAIEGLVKHYNFNPLWFYYGQGEPFPGARKKYPEVCGPDSPQIYSEPDFPSDEFVFIRQLKGKISAGNGMSPDNAIDMRVAFRRDWINRKGDPDNMSLIKISGDSMEPTFMSGDLVLVDHGKTSVAPNGGIYAISIEQEIMIKRIQPIISEGRFRVISDNHRYEPIDIEAGDLRINGKVIWFARDLER